MRYRIETTGEGLDVEFTDAKGREAMLVEAFKACQSGRCACPTQEFRKLRSIEIVPGEGKVRLVMRARPGASLDCAEIEKCVAMKRRSAEPDD